MDTLDREHKIEVAIQQFTKAAEIHAKSTEIGDYKTGNKNYDFIVNSIKELKNLNAIDALLPYLNDNQNVGVRLWAARYLLKKCECKAIQVLKEVMQKGDIHSFDAEMTLEEWNKGNLKM